MYLLSSQFQSNLNHLLDNHYPKVIAIAVSGGSDSVALLMLAHKWAISHGVGLIVMIVNHNLRADATLEIEYVMNLAHGLGYSCAVLNWDHQNNFANLQARAREARYSLMTSLCRQLDVLTLLTAHHQDDNIENLLIRRERKSSILGLHSDNINFIGNIRILRPLFNINKAELLSYLIANNISWFEDESNKLEKYQRNKIRISLARQELEVKKELTSLQFKIAEEVSAIKLLLVSAIAESVIIHKYGFAKVDLNSLSKFTNNIQLQTLNFALTIISGHTKVPRSKSSVSILSSLNDEQKFVKTLHGCVLYKEPGALFIYREFGKATPQNVQLAANVRWDNRFHVDNIDIKLPQHAYITTLLAQDYKYLKQKLDLPFILKDITDLAPNNYKAILFTLPVIKIFEKVIALPHISYYDNAYLEGKLELSFQPNFISRFTHFC